MIAGFDAVACPSTALEDDARVGLHPLIPGASAFAHIEHDVAVRIAEA